MFTPQSIVYAWDNQLNYALALLKDITDEQFIERPGGNMNHPAWIIGHLAAYHPVVIALLKGAQFDDPKDDPLYGFAGHGPQDALEANVSKQTVVDRFAAGHEMVAEALLGALPEDFNRQPSLPRWANCFPSVQFMLPDLLIFHESMHIGQISMWRRAIGLPRIEIPERTIRSGLI